MSKQVAGRWRCRPIGVWSKKQLGKFESGLWYVTCLRHSSFTLRSLLSFLCNQKVCGKTRDFLSEKVTRIDLVLLPGTTNWTTRWCAKCWARNWARAIDAISTRWDSIAFFHIRSRNGNRRTFMGRQLARNRSDSA